MEDNSSHTYTHTQKKDYPPTMRENDIITKDSYTVTRRIKDTIDVRVRNTTEGLRLWYLTIRVRGRRGRSLTFVEIFTTLGRQD